MEFKHVCFLLTNKLYYKKTIKNYVIKVFNNTMGMDGVMCHEDKVGCGTGIRSLSRFMAIQRNKAGKEVVNCLLLQRDNLRCR